MWHLENAVQERSIRVETKWLRISKTAKDLYEALDNLPFAVKEKKVRDRINFNSVNEIKTSTKDFRKALDEAIFFSLHRILPNIPENVSRKIYGLTQRGFGKYDPEYLAGSQLPDELSLKEALHEQMLLFTNTCRSLTYSSKLKRPKTLESRIQDIDIKIKTMEELFFNFKKFCLEVLGLQEPATLTVEENTNFLDNVS